MCEPELYYLTTADLRAIPDDVAGQHLVRDPGLLESATARPRATVFGADAYPSLWAEAATPPELSGAPK